MNRLITGVSILVLALPTFAQQQQAGNAASTDTDGTFQALVDACDDVDALMLRARIRLQIPRTTDEAAAKAEDLLKEGFTTCAGGDVEGGKAQLSEALAIAEAGTEEKFDVDKTVTASNEASAEPANAQSTEAETEDKPWWQFW